MQPELQTYERLGYATFNDVLSQKVLLNLERTIRSMMDVAIQKLEPEKKQQFHDQFRDGMDLLHDGLLLLYTLDSRMSKLVIDAASSSQSLFSLFSDPAVIELTCMVVGVDSPTKLGAIEHYMRVDYPTIDRGHVAKISLPYHQESSYYKKNVSASRGTVCWIPLFDCGPQQGSLKIRPGSHLAGFAEHESYYLDPEKKRHLRERLPEKTINRYSEESLTVKRGGLAFQHFHLFHCSGENTTRNHVRYTMLARYTDITADDYVPVSWT